MEEMGTSLNKKKLKLNKSMTLLGLITLSFSLVDKSAGIFSFKYLIRFVAIFFSFKNLKFLWFTFTFMSSLTFFTINFKRSENLRSFKLLQKPKKCCLILSEGSKMSRKKVFYNIKTNIIVGNPISSFLKFKKDVCACCFGPF